MINDLNWDCQQPKPEDRRNFNTQQDLLKCRDNGERPTGEKNATIEWDYSEKGTSNLILII